MRGSIMQNGFFFGAHTLVNEVAGDLESSLSGSLTVTGLEHIELAVFNGELHILHIAVVIFEVVADLDELRRKPPGTSLPSERWA